MADFPPELIDKVISNLHDSTRAMRCCALVSKQWLAITRHHLFRTIRFDHRHWRTLYGSICRFQSVLEINRELPSFIREVVINWSLSFVTSLFKTLDLTCMTRLETISLQFISFQVGSDTMLSFQAIFDLPSLKNLTLISSIFKDIEQFALFFDKCRPNIEALSFHDLSLILAKELDSSMRCFPLGSRSRVKLKSLAFVRGPLDHLIPWFLHPQCPIALDDLDQLKYHHRLPMLAELLQVVGPSLKSLEISCPTRMWFHST